MIHYFEIPALKDKKGPHFSEELRQRYEELGYEDVRDLVAFWVKEGEEIVPEETDPRAVGFLLKSLVDLQPEAVMRAVHEIALTVRGKLEPPEPELMGNLAVLLCAASKEQKQNFSDKTTGEKIEEEVKHLAKEFGDFCSYQGSILGAGKGLFLGLLNADDRCGVYDEGAKGLLQFSGRLLIPSLEALREAPDLISESEMNSDSEEQIRKNLGLFIEGAKSRSGIFVVPEKEWEKSPEDIANLASRWIQRREVVPRGSEIDLVIRSEGFSADLMAQLFAASMSSYESWEHVPVSLRELFIESFEHKKISKYGFGYILQASVGMKEPLPGFLEKLVSDPRYDGLFALSPEYLRKFLLYKGDFEDFSCRKRTQQFLEKGFAVFPTKMAEKVQAACESMGQEAQKELTESLLSAIFYKSINSKMLFYGQKPVSEFTFFTEQDPKTVDYSQFISPEIWQILRPSLDRVEESESWKKVFGYNREGIFPILRYEI